MSVSSAGGEAVSEVEGEAVSETRTPIEIMLDGIDWRKVTEEFPEADIPHVTHEGYVTIGGFPLTVYQLSDGSRVFEAHDFEKFLGFKP